MALTSKGLSSLVVIDHLSTFPEAATVSRSNPATGVPPHNPSLAFIDALCDAVVTALKTLTILDIGSGTNDVPGTAVPVPFTFPGIMAAEALLISQAAWKGPASAQASHIFIGSVLTNVSKIGLLQMNDNKLVGTGTGVVSPISNPGLEDAARAALQAALPASFQATGKYGTNDVPGTPVNPVLLKLLAIYASGLAKGISSITSSVVYVGTTLTVSAVSGIVNSGVLL